MTAFDIRPLAKIMQQLRDPENGCPWDLEQDFSSIAPYTIEEAYEVSDAIERKDMDGLRDELGDLLLQVVFHSQMASEAGHFNLNDVIEGICDKMVRRHPHVFGNVDANSSGEVITNWETIKAAERSDSNEDKSALAGVAMALPALLRAQKIQKRAARTGFDWPSIDGAIDKLQEEVVELAEATTDAQKTEEMGDLLFAAVNISRHLKIDAEAALIAATRKFEHRFRHMENKAGKIFSDLSLEAKESHWLAAKLSEQRSS